MILLIDLAYDAAGVTYREAVGRNALGNDATRTDDTASPNGNTSYDDDISTNPATIFYGDGEGVGAAKIFFAIRAAVGGQPIGQFYGMGRSGQVHIGGNEHIVTDDDFIAVDEHAIQVDGDIRAYLYMAAITTDEGCTHGDIMPYFAEKFFQDVGALFFLFVAGVIV